MPVMLQKSGAKSKEKAALLNQRVNAVCRLFSSLYPDAASELNFSNEYELAVAVMLSAQCTDRKVNEVTPELFSRFPDFKALARAKAPQIEKIIRPVNYYRTKARHIRETARILSSTRKGALPRTLDELIELPGIGRKTASVILTELRAAHTMPVDTHVYRLARRLGFSKGRNVRDVEEDLKALFLPHTWRSLHHWLILHGRRVCRAQRPLCAGCALRGECPSAAVDS